MMAADKFSWHVESLLLRSTRGCCAADLLVSIAAYLQKILTNFEKLNPMSITSKTRTDLVFSGFYRFLMLLDSAQALRQTI